MLLKNINFTENILHNDLIYRYGSIQDRFTSNMIFKDKNYKFLNEKRAEKSRKQRNNKKRVRKKVKKSKMPLPSLIQSQAHPLNITKTTRKKKAQRSKQTKSENKQKTKTNKKTIK